MGISKNLRKEVPPMKKLLVIALLMLALVITAGACQPTPDEPDTSADDVTTAETPTEAPTDEPSTPAPETEPETPAPETQIGRAHV